MNIPKSWVESWIKSKELCEESSLDQSINWSKSSLLLFSSYPALKSSANRWLLTYWPLAKFWKAKINFKTSQKSRVKYRVKSRIMAWVNFSHLSIVLSSDHSLSLQFLANFQPQSLQLPADFQLIGLQLNPGNYWLAFNLNLSQSFMSVFKLTSSLKAFS